MKTKVFLIIVLTVLFGVGWVQADTVWTSGHHEIVDGEVYGEIWMYNDATLDILGGDIFRLAAYNTTLTDWYDGEMGALWTRDDSIVNIYGGDLGGLWAAENSLVNLYAYDVTYDPSGGYYNLGRIEGTYINNDLYFGFDLAGSDTFSHINVVPQPLDAEVDVRPKTLNLKSKGKWITCHVWLPEEYSVSEIDPDSILLERRFKAEWKWFNEKQNVVKAKFKRSELKEILEPGEIELIVSCHLLDGTYFEGTDTIRVIDKGRLRRRRVNSNSKVVDGIEYYIQTDKSVYNLGENVEMLYRVTNLRNEEWRFGYMPPVLDILVAAKERESFNAVWFWSWDKIWPMGPKVFRLEPGESIELNGIWPQIDLNGSVEPEDHTHVPPGRYRISGVFYPTDSSIAVDITIIRREGRGRPTRVNSNSIVEDGIEYYIQTDKAVYNLGENVEMLYKVTNLTDQDVVIACDRAGEFNLWVQKDGETIWALYHWFVWYSPGVELLAGESTDLPPYNWDMKDDNGNLVEPGIYNVVGVMYNGPTEVKVPINIIPEQVH